MAEIGEKDATQRLEWKALRYVILLNGYSIYVMEKSEDVNHEPSRFLSMSQAIVSMFSELCTSLGVKQLSFPLHVNRVERYISKG